MKLLAAYAGIFWVANSCLAMTSSSLRADVYLAPAISAVPPVPIPNNIASFWSPTAATLISSAHEAVLVDPLFTMT